jgi:hypothetical protein
MKYDKPEVVKVANAAYAIQGQSEKADQSNPDAETNFIYDTLPAYEADE